MLFTMTQAQEEAYYVLLGWLTQEIKVKARPENPGSPTEDSCPVPAPPQRPQRPQRPLGLSFSRTEAPSATSYLN